MKKFLLIPIILIITAGPVYAQTVMTKMVNGVSVVLTAEQVAKIKAQDAQVEAERPVQIEKAQEKAMIAAMEKEILRRMAIQELKDSGVVLKHN